MATLIAFIVLIGIVTALGMAALAWGTDSRPTLGDDHAR
jgi:hypothetical protein